MTVCKTFSNEKPQRGQKYKKAELLPNLKNPERMASSYFDPQKDILYTFFDGNSKEWINEHDPRNRTLEFRHRTLQTLEECPAWERAKIRHVFLRAAGDSSGGYEYIGSAAGEERFNTAGFDTVRYRLLKPEE